MALKKIAVAIVALGAAALAAFLVFDGIFNKTVSTDFFAMNTYVTATVTGTDSEDCASELRSVVESLDKDKLSRTRADSSVSQLNKNGGGNADGKIAEWFSVLLDVCRKSAGAFDFTLGTVSDLWSFGSEPKIPEAEVLAEALSHTGYEKITLSGGRLDMADKEAVIDFGATGKGIALDEIKASFDGKRIKEAVVSVGGSVLLYGDKKFTVGIRDPQGNAGRYVAKLHVSETCVSTSGSYEQQFEQNGKKYHHILDPKTGYPVNNGLISVTVVSESGILSDALSTACFVLGIGKGSALAAEYGCTAIFITENKKIYVEGDSTVIEITDEAYTLAEQS